jgi:hypothetical protein
MLRFVNNLCVLNAATVFVNLLKSGLFLQDFKFLCELELPLSQGHGDLKIIHSRMIFAQNWQSVDIYFLHKINVNTPVFRLSY